MKLILMIADAARLDEVRQDLAALGASGWTGLPVTEGAGRTGVHAGDRVHPGALAALFVVEPEARADTLFDALARRRREANDAVTRLFLLPVERIA